MTDTLLACFELEPKSEARSTVIWLHGLGADGRDFEPIVPHLGLDESQGVRFVFPHAPPIPVTVNMGFVMPAWYDIIGLDRTSPQDEAGVLRSCAHLEALVAREKERGIPSERILLAGFSQGGAIAIHTALRHPDRLAGLLALSTYMVMPGRVEAERSEANKGLEVFQAHGTRDPMVPFEFGTETRDGLLALGHPVEWHEYSMQHEVCPDEIADIGRWLRERLG